MMITRFALNLFRGPHLSVGDVSNRRHHAFLSSDSGASFFTPHSLPELALHPLADGGLQIVRRSRSGGRGASAPAGLFAPPSRGSRTSRQGSAGMARLWHASLLSDYERRRRRRRTTKVAEPTISPMPAPRGKTMREAVQFPVVSASWKNPRAPKQRPKARK